MAFVASMFALYLFFPFWFEETMCRVAGFSLLELDGQVGQIGVTAELVVRADVFWLN